MRWKGRRQSSNIEDRRGQSSSMGGARSALGTNVGGMVVRQLLSGTTGKQKIIILLLVAAAIWFFKLDPSILTGGQPLGASQPSATQAGAQPDDELGQFVAVVLADTEDTWRRLFTASGQTYKEPRLVLFSDATRSGCGTGQAAMGPFYCPADQQVYIDLSFYRDLRERYKAPGDFAQAYVIAHEVGHHIQTLLGISSKVHAQQQSVSKADANQLSVKQELQADCLAGVWAHHAKRQDLLEAGDVDEALTAAAAIGDDRLQRQAQGRVVPESFTHGTSEQRQQWLRRGMQSGKMADCDTFSEAAATLEPEAIQLPAEPTAPANLAGFSTELTRLIARQHSGEMVTTAAQVVKILPDDNDGSRHQRFLIADAQQGTVLVAHNIDLAPRLPLQAGDRINIRGQYEWNDRGGVLHWTHHDPQGNHPGGWIEHQGKRYE